MPLTCTEILSLCLFICVDYLPAADMWMEGRRVYGRRRFYQIIRIYYALCQADLNPGIWLSGSLKCGRWFFFFPRAAVDCGPYLLVTLYQFDGLLK